MKEISILIILLISSCSQSSLREDVVWSHPASGVTTPTWADSYYSDHSESERLANKNSYYQPQTQTIHLGMGANQVRGLWGEPSAVEFAGSENANYQRWVYPSSPVGGLTGDQRIVYIEYGQVVGWETRSDVF